MAPSALISLSRKALLSGRIAPESIDLVSPRLTLLYGEDGTLALKFATPAEPAGSERAKVAVRRGTAEAPVAPSAGQVDAEGGLGRIDLVKILSEASARARRRERASAYLREIGLKSATVIIDHSGRKSIWRVLELGVDLDHRRSRSSIAGRAKIESLAGPWTLDFRTYEIEATNKLQLAVSVQGLVPRGLARSLPQLAGLESLDVPVWAEAKLDLSNTGEILSGTIDIDAAPGRVSLPWLAATPLRIDGGHLALAYDKAARRLTIAPSVLVWGDSRVQFTGTVAHTAEGAEGARWAFDLRSAGGWIGAEPPHIPQLTIDDWTARGFVAPERGRAVLSEFRLKAGGAEISAEGDVADMAGAMQARLDGKIGPMPASIFKAIWPAPLAPRSRDWVVKHLVRGWLQGGSFRLATNAGVGAGSGWAATTAPSQGSLTLEAANLAFSLVDSWPTLEAPRALVRLDDQSFELRLPDATVTAADGRQLALKGTFSVDMTEPLPRTGRVAVRGQGPLSAALDMLDRPPFGLVQKSGLSVAGVDGKVDTQLTVVIPARPGAGAARHRAGRQDADHRSPPRSGARPLPGARRQHHHRHDADGGRGQGRHADQRGGGQGHLAARVRRAPREAAAAQDHGHPRQQLPHPARPRHQRPGAGRRRHRGDDLHRCAQRAPRPCACRSRQCRGRARQRRLAQAQGQAQRVRVRCGQGHGRLSDRAAQRQAGRRRRGDRRLDGDRVRQQGQGVPLPQLLAQRHHQPRDARQDAPRRRLGRDREGPHLRRPRTLPLVLRCRPSGRPERQDQAGPRPQGRNHHRGRLHRHHAAQREDDAAEAVQQADRARRARDARGRQGRSPPWCGRSPAGRAP